MGITLSASSAVSVKSLPFTVVVTEMPARRALR